MSAKSTYADHFSSGASGYATYRPQYPRALFRWLAELCEHHRRAWDCGTGNGQAAVGLARQFDVVIATDPSQAQIAQRMHDAGVHYAVMTAESSAMSSRSVDLVTVAQALHWFNLPRFYDEVRRTLVPGGVVCAWTYGLLGIGPGIDAHIARFYKEEVGPYWPPERVLVDRGYADIDFPFEELAVPPFEMVAEWTLAQLSGYLETWSAVARYRREVGHSPVPVVIESIAEQWGAPGRIRQVRWPLEIRAGRSRS